MEYTLEDLKKLMQSSLGTIVIYTIEGKFFTPILYTPNVPKFSGLTDQEYKDLYRQGAASIVAPNDLPILHDKLTKTLAGIGEQTAIFRVFHKIKGFAWIHVIVKLLGTYQGKPLVLGAFSDVTSILSASNLLLDNSNQLIYVIERDTYDLLFANAVAQKDKPSFLKMGQVCYEYVRGNTAPCPNCIIKQIKGEEPLNAEWYDSQCNKYFEVKAVPMTFFGKKAYAFFINDLFYHKELERALEEEKGKYQAATEGANLRVYEYDIVHHSIHLPEHARELFGVPNRDIENVPESILPQFQKQDYDRVRAFFARVDKGEKNVKDEFLMQTPGNPGPYLRYIFTTTFDKLGKPIKAYAVAEDISAQKQKEIDFQQALQALLTANPDTVCSFRLNLTQNTCVSGHGASQYITNLLDSDTSDGLFKKILAIIPDNKQRQQARELFDRKNLLAAFNQGKTNLRLDYQRLDEHNQLVWIRTYAKMLKNPETQEIISVFSSLDISKEKRQEQIFNIFTNEEFDYVALVYTRTNQLEFLNLSYKLNPKYHQELGKKNALFDFTKMREYTANRWIAQEDKAYYLQNSSLEVVCRELDRQGHYELSVRGHYLAHPNEVMCRKIQHYYLDERKDVILIIQTDVTQTYLQQEKLNAQAKKQMEMSVLDTIGRLPSVSVLFKVTEQGSLQPERYSDEFCRLKGCTQENIEAFHAQAGCAPIHPDDLERLKKEVVLSELSGHYKKVVYRISTKNRGYIWVNASYVYFRIGEQGYVYVVYTDIDDLKKQEQMLEEKYNSAQTFLDTFSGGYYVTRRINLTTNTIEYTQGTAPIENVRKITKYDLLVNTILKHMPIKEQRAGCAQYYSAQTLRENYEKGISSTSLEYQVRDFYGDIKWIKSTNTVTKRPSNGDLILFNAITDITQEKLTATVMDKIIKQRYDYFACIDAKKGIVALFISNTPSLSEKNIRLGDDYNTVVLEHNKKYLDPADIETVNEYMYLPNVIKKLDKGESCVFSVAIKENGVTRMKQIDFFYVDKDSDLIALVRTDYTEAQKKQMEQEAKLKLALNAAQKANKAKTDFLSNMSHDIRTPLNGIIGMTYLTKEMALPSEAKSNLEKIDTSSKFLLSLINDVLDMAKAESGKIVLHPEPYTVKEFYDYLKSIIQPLCDSKGQKFILDSQAIETAVPLVDKLRVNQIFFNLLSNAVKYTPEGGTITFRMRQALSADDKLLTDIQIKDNGIGMSEEFQKILFDPFTQEEQEGGRGNQGTGLGLSIVKRLLDLMGGTISVTSKVGVGSKFTLRLTLPCQNAMETKDKAACAVQKKDWSALRGKRVLLCEDQALNREIAKTLLQKKGMIVDMAFNGLESVDKFSKSAPDFYAVILMDIKMPVMNGYVAAENIRKSNHPAAKTVPIIAMTADAFAEDVQKALDSGMNGHIAKPINPDKMFTTIMEITAKSGKKS